VAEKLIATLTEKTLEGSVAKCCQQRGILLPLLCYLVVNKVTEGLNVNGCYTLGMCYCHQRKIPKECPTASSGGFEYGTTVLWYNADINRSRKGSAPGSMPCKTRSIRKKSVSKTQNFFQSVRLLSA